MVNGRHLYNRTGTEEVNLKKKKSEGLAFKRKSLQERQSGKAFPMNMEKVRGFLKQMKLLTSPRSERGDRVWVPFEGS